MVHVTQLVAQGAHVGEGGVVLFTKPYPVVHPSHAPPPFVLHPDAQFAEQDAHVLEPPLVTGPKDT